MGGLIYGGPYRTQEEIPDAVSFITGANLRRRSPKTARKRQRPKKTRTKKTRTKKK
jgi:hypothetical protein